MAMTLNELGQATDVSPSHLGRIERGERYPSAHILKRLAGPLGIEEAELMSRAGYLSPPSDQRVENTGREQLDPHVAMALSQEPVEVQRAVIAILSILKSIASNLT